MNHTYIILLEKCFLIREKVEIKLKSLLMQIKDMHTLAITILFKGFVN